MSENQLEEYLMLASRLSGFCDDFLNLDKIDQLCHSIIENQTQPLTNQEDQGKPTEQEISLPTGSIDQVQQPPEDILHRCMVMSGIFSPEQSNLPSSKDSTPENYLVLESTRQQTEQEIFLPTRSIDQVQQPPEDILHRCMIMSGILSPEQSNLPSSEVSIPEYQFVLESTNIPIKTDPPQTTKSQPPFACKYCPLMFITRAFCRTHESTHEMNRNHQCPECLQRFSQSSNLKRHMRMHAGERPFECSECKKSFGQLSNLTTHQKRKHKPGRL